MDMKRVIIVYLHLWPRECVRVKYTHLLSLLAYTDPRIPFILYTDAYDIACGALVQNVHCTPVVSTAVR